MNLPFAEYRALLATYVKPHWGRMLLLLFLLLSGIGLQLLNPLILRVFIADAQAGSSLIVLLRTALFFIIVALTGQVVAVIESYTATDLAWHTTNELRTDMVLHCLRLDMDFHHTHTPGEMIERIDGDIGMLNQFFSRFIIAVLANALFLVGVLIIMCVIDWRIGLAMGGYALLTLTVMLLLRRTGTTPWAAARQSSADLFGFLEERLSGTEEIRASGAIAYLLSRLYLLFRRRLKTERRALSISLLIMQVTKFLFMGGTILAFSLSAVFFKAGALSLATVYLFYNYTQQLTQPLMQISRHLDNFQQTIASIKRLQTLLHLQPGVADGTGMRFADSADAGLAIEFQGVSFGYTANNFVLKDISFTLAPGQVLGVLGRTGSGKTTLTRLLFRLYDPQQGSIRLDGVDIRTERLLNIRQRIGLVTQDIQLFHATIRENVTMFDAAIADTAILAALRQLGLWTWYQALPQGLDTLLTASGDGLSAGEGQLLALTRVFLRQPAVVVLDEATSRLDPATEALIELAMDRLLHNRTGIIIAHRLSTIRRADSLVILEDGCICEQGMRTALLADPASRFSHLLRTGQEDILV